MFLEDCVVLSNKWLGDSYYLMKIKISDNILIAKAGQFFMLRVSDDIYQLRRPISIHYVDHKKKEMDFYYELKGTGTKLLSEMEKNDSINIQGPLGNGFSTEYKDKNILIIGGGMGIAPLKYLLKKLDGNKIDFIVGGRNQTALNILENFDNLDNSSNVNLHIVTDDGSVGKKGTVIDIMKTLISEKSFDRIMTCGPHGMMHAVAEIADKNSIPCEISLENRMACGVNACLGCSVPTNNGMKRVCHDGPVFDINKIL